MEFLGKPLGRGNHKAVVCECAGAAHIRKNMILACGVNGSEAVMRAVEDKDDFSFYVESGTLEYGRQQAEAFKSFPYRAPQRI